MKLLIVGVCLLFSLSQGLRLRQTYQPNDIRLEDVRHIFRETLLEMVGLSINITIPELKEVGQKMKQCEKRIHEEREDCRECVETSCRIDADDIFQNSDAQEKMNFNDVESVKRMAPEIHTEYGYGGDGFGTRPDIRTSNDKRILFSTIAAGCLAGLGVLDAGITIGSFISNNWSNWFGRRKRSYNAVNLDDASVHGLDQSRPELRTCLRKCPPCKTFKGDKKTLMLAVCGEKLVLKFAKLSVRIEALKGLYEHLYDPAPLLQKIEVNNADGDEYLQVTAMFPSGPHTYDSLVPLIESDHEVSQELAVEYFELWSKDRS